MDLSDLTRTLESRGVTIYASGGRLRISGRRAALTPDLQRLASRHARALLYRLTLYRRLHRGDRVQTPDGPGAGSHPKRPKKGETTNTPCKPEYPMHS